MPGADLALASATIADAREVFEIVIEIHTVNGVVRYENLS